MDNFILNWTNKCKHDDNAVVAGVTHMAANLKEKGYKRAETQDVLLSNDFPLTVIEAALEVVYTKKAAKEEVVVRKLPTSYDDMKPFVSNLLHDVTAEKFASMISLIVNAGYKNFLALRRLAEAAQNSPAHEAELHKYIAPWFEEELLSSVEAADKTQNVRVAAELKIDKKQLTCSCKKFTDRHYAELGLVCEHLINKCR